jgi:hypothetical protein
MKTLILNSDSKPLSVVDIKRAVILENKNSNITALSYYDKKILSTRGEVKIPAVMIYSKYIKITYRKFPSKRAIRIRDKNKCAYCDILLSPDELTIDHVIPVSRFEDKSRANTWENQVCCCKKCNLKKGNKTPQEAGMSLLFKPKKIDVLFLMDNVPVEWQKYI